MSNTSIKLTDLPEQNTLTQNTKLVTINSDTNTTELGTVGSLVNLVGSYLTNTTINVVRSSIDWFPTYTEYTSNTNITQIIDSFSASGYKSAKYNIQVSANTQYQASELLVVHDGSNIANNEVVLYTGASRICHFSADILGANVVIKATPTSNTVTTIKFVRVKLPS